MKYLYKKIEQAHSAYFNQIIFIGNELCRPKLSEAMEEFQSLDLSEICKTLGWRDEKKTHDLITAHLKSGEELSRLLYDYDGMGFLAECHMPECDNFSATLKNGRPTSWSVHPGICDVFWLYAESFGELVFKLEEETERRFLEMVNKAQK